MKIKALEDFRFFNNNGFREIKKDEEFEVNDELAKDFLRMGLVEFLGKSNDLKFKKVNGGA